MTVTNVSNGDGELQALFLNAVRAATSTPTLAIRGTFTPISGGYCAKIYGVEFDNAPPDLDRPLVLRVLPNANHPEHEIAMQRAIAELGYPAPTVRLADPTETTIGQPYMLMDRAVGVPLLSNLALGRAITMLPRILASLPKILANALVELHQLDTAPVRAALTATGIEKSEGATSLLSSLIASPGVEHVASLQQAVGWLRQHEPPVAQVVVCHGDLHPLNILAVGTDVTAIIDWTGARFADPAFDVGCTAVLVAQAPLAAPKAVQPILRAIGRSLARRFVKQYRTRMPLDETQLKWHEAWQCTRAIAEVANWRLIGAAVQTHPFETSLAGLTKHLRSITGIEVVLPGA